MLPANATSGCCLLEKALPQMPQKPQCVGWLFINRAQQRFACAFLKFLRVFGMLIDASVMRPDVLPTVGHN
jgi:hypothetical protein